MSIPSNVNTYTTSYLLQASKLQMTMMETMEAADIEKQKHNSTRMEAFVRLAKLEVLQSLSFQYDIIAF